MINQAPIKPNVAKFTVLNTCESIVYLQNGDSSQRPPIFREERSLFGACTTKRIQFYSRKAKAINFQAAAGLRSSQSVIGLSLLTLPHKVRIYHRRNVLGHFYGLPSVIFYSSFFARRKAEDGTRAMKAFHSNLMRRNTMHLTSGHRRIYKRTKLSKVYVFTDCHVPGPFDSPTLSVLTIP